MIRIEQIALRKLSNNKYTAFFKKEGNVIPNFRKAARP